MSPAEAPGCDSWVTRVWSPATVGYAQPGVYLDTQLYKRRAAECHVRGDTGSDRRGREN